MLRDTKQHRLWKGVFGGAYVGRNHLTPKQLDRDYLKTYGTTRSVMNREFLRGVPKDARILEVGANVGNILLSLCSLGYRNLFGVELNPRVVEFAHKRAPNLGIIAGDVLDIPFKDDFFDLVFTSGVLIHIAPENRKCAMREICRVSRKYVWGFEYFSDRSQEIPYRGKRNVLWKADFPSLFLSAAPSLRLVKRELYDYKTQAGNRDVMFLLKKVAHTAVGRGRQHGVASNKRAPSASGGF